MAQSPIVEAMQNVCDEKGIPFEVVVETLEAALAAAYRKDFGQPNQNIKVEFNKETGGSRVFDSKIVVPDELKAEWEKAIAEAKARQEAGLPPEEVKITQMPQTPSNDGVAADGADATTVAPAAEAVPEEEELRYHPRLHLTITEAKEKKPDAKEGDEIITELTVPAEYGRMAAQTAKQVIMQKLREAERAIIFEDFKDKQGTILQGTVQRRLGPNYLIDFGRVNGILPVEEQIERERYMPGSRFKFYVKSVSMGPKGPEIIISRSTPEMVRQLFSIEIPEIGNGLVEILAVAREAGSRSKIAVRSTADNVDPIGSCVGQRGSRVQTVIGELGGEKIDIIEWSEHAQEFIQNALSPAKAESVTLHEDVKSASVIVKDDQLSLAIGRGGQNVRLASQLTGWKLSISGDGSGAVHAPGEAGPGSAGDHAPAASPAEAGQVGGPATMPRPKLCGSIAGGDLGGEPEAPKEETTS